MIDRGRLILDHTKSSDFYGDFMLSYNKQIQDFTIGVNAGGSMMNSSYDQWMITPIAKSGAPYTEDLSCNQFVLSDIYINSSDNYGGLTTKNWERAIFATAQVTWQDKVTSRVATATTGTAPSRSSATWIPTLPTIRPVPRHK